MQDAGRAKSLIRSIKSVGVLFDCIITELEMQYAEKHPV
jgi:hypothetical protein